MVEAVAERYRSSVRATDTEDMGYSAAVDELMTYDDDGAVVVVGSMRSLEFWVRDVAREGCWFWFWVWCGDMGEPDMGGDGYAAEEAKAAEAVR